LVAPGLLASTLIFAACGGPTLSPGQEESSTDEAEITASLIAAIKTITSARSAEGILPRLNQAKSLGCVNATFAVNDDLPPDLAQGVFQPGHRYDALVRFANASTEDDRDKDFRGMSIKLYGVDGEKLWGKPGQQDFLLNSYPGLFAEDPAEFLAFVEATADDARWKFFINPAHWDALMIILRGREKVTNPFAVSFFSTTPFRHGPDKSVAVKYSALPCDAEQEVPVVADGPDFLRDAMAATLATREVCFDFAVQFQGDPAAMPIEDASVIWDEAESPYRSVATLHIADQEFATETALLDCEQQTFNPWQSLPDHQPLGGINRVRRAVYSEAAAFRLEQSKYPQREAGGSRDQE
jgi:catalase